jgi:hypothetical protein
MALPLNRLQEIDIMRRLLFLFASLLFAATIHAQSPQNLGEITAKLPPLSREAGVITLPLGTDGPLAWRPVREGITVHQTEGALATSYQVASGQPAGAALMIRPGTLAGLRSLRLKLRGNRNANLTIALHDAAGVVYAFPAVPVRVGDAREAEVSIDDLSYLAPASKAPDPGSFDPAGAVMVTLLDISGFLSSETPEVGWTIESFEGVVQ